jgi:cytoskeletal protein RodZ
MLRDAMTEKQRGNTKQPPWQRDNDGESVPFGPWLRRQREMREITLREISDATKISLRYLQALEDERFDLLPAMVFAKGFLRQYARYVGLDQDEVVNRFLVAHQGEEEEPEEGEEGAQHEALRQGGALEGTWKYAVLIIVVAVVLLGLVFLIPHLFGGDGDGAERSQPPPGVAPPQAPAQVGDETPGRTPEGDPARAAGAAGIAPDLPEAPLRVTLDFREDCWVEAAVDGERRVSEMRVQGESLQLQAQEVVEMRLGNAGVVDVEVNGRPYDLEARPGDVRRVRIDLSDLPGAEPPSDAAPGEEGDGNGAPAAGAVAGTPS